MGLVTIAFLFLAAALMISGGVLCIAAAFQQSLLWGLGYLFGPVGQLVFVIAHWTEARKGFLISTAGMGFFAIATFSSPVLRQMVAASMHIPGLAPAPSHHAVDEYAASIEQQRLDLLGLQDQLSRVTADAGNQYAALTQRRSHLDIHNPAAVHQFNLDAAAYGQERAQLAQLGAKIAAGNGHLDELLASQEAANRKRVIIYTTSTCPFCKAAKQYMDAKGIEYEEVNLETSPEGREAFAKYGGNGVPLIVVGDKTLRGFSPEALDAML
jgi:glutaredoxin